MLLSELAVGERIVKSPGGHPPAVDAREGHRREAARPPDSRREAGEGLLEFFWVVL